MARKELVPSASNSPGGSLGTTIRQEATVTAETIILVVATLWAGVVGLVIVATLRRNARLGILAGTAGLALFSAPFVLG